jgi:hypothetical protein
LSSEAQQLLERTCLLDASFREFAADDRDLQKALALFT